jgi:hypothetical protein
MENNYMDARGDSAHAVWKSRAQRGDIVLKRRGSQVLISNYSVGIWQITRETLRYAHRLYEHDGRDYERLPAGLRPAPALDLDAVDARVLTVYAGLLFRDLLDRCGGDVDCAVGAYNGGLRNPNYLYPRNTLAISWNMPRSWEPRWRACSLWPAPESRRWPLEPDLRRLLETG